MKRQIKFRAWDGEQMHYNIVPWQWDFVISLAWHKCEKSTGTGILGSGGPTGEFLVPGIRFKELMQFTGLHDKNGNEIYEGDIVNFHSFLFAGYSDAGSPDGPDEVFEDMIGPVTFYEGSFGVDIGFGHVPLSAHDDIEIIGNIYQNPELLDP